MDIYSHEQYSETTIWMQSVQLQHVFYTFIKVELHLQLHIQEKSVQIWMDL